MAYSAYGELLTGKVSGFGYNGEYYDAATGMLNLRARQYEPAQGRFSQRDSLKGWVTSPRSLNVYLYCQNDAINYFDASGATMVAVNMTDGGGGKKSNSSSSTLFQKAGQTIKNVVSTAASAAAVAKAVNDQALKKGLVNSILKESRDPVAQLQRVRENRTRAQATTPTVREKTFLRSIKLTACRMQEEYDAGDEVYGPQPSSSYYTLGNLSNESTWTEDINAAIASSNVDVPEGWRIVGGGIQVDVNCTVLKSFPWGQGEGGGEIVIYADKHVVEQTYPGASFIVATYVYVGGDFAVDPAAGGGILTGLLSDDKVTNAIMDISSGMETNPISGSASVFAILGNENFNSPRSYTEWFTSYSGTVKHVRGYYSSAPNAKSIGLGYSTSLFSIDCGETYYYLIDSAPFGIPNDGFFDTIEGVVR